MAEAIVRERTARKPHQCGRCLRTIQPGERYATWSVPPNSDMGNTTWWSGKEHLSTSCVLDDGTARCKHCRKPVVRCESVPGQHIGCSSGYGWIHTNPEQWGHSCRPRSGAPYAQELGQ